MPTGSNKVLQVLEALASSKDELSVSELALRSGVSRPAVTRLVPALVKRGYAVRDARTKKLSPGLRFYDLGINALRRRLPLRPARRQIVELVSSVHRRVDLVVLEGSEAVLIERCEWMDGLAVSVPAPFRAPWHQTACGRAIAAFADADLLQDLTGGATNGKRGRRPAPPGDLDLVRERGYAEVRGDLTPDHFAVAVPIFDHGDHPVAAIGMPMRPDDLDSEALERYLIPLRRTAETISGYLGHHSPSHLAVT